MLHLLWYNTLRPHKTLGLKSPINCLLKRYPESQMYADLYKKLTIDKKIDRITLN